MEKILIENPNRFTVFPIDKDYTDIWKLYKKSVSNVWTVEELDFSNDYNDFVKLRENEQYFIKKVLAFFAASDGIVNENLVLNFYNEIQVAEIRQLYATQIFIEAIHNECYSLLIDTLIKDYQEKELLLSSVVHDPTIIKKAAWAKKWITEGSFARRLIGFLVVEGLFFSASFCSIFWIKNKGILKALTTSNEWISRDEGLHAQTAVAVYYKLQNRLNIEEIHSIFKEAVALECEFVDDILKTNLLGMNAESMKIYVKYVADYWLTQLGCTRLYNVECPFDFMNKMNISVKENYFEVKVTNYQTTMKKEPLNFQVQF